MEKERGLADRIAACRAGEDDLIFWWLGQMGFAVRMGGRTIFADPYLSADEARLYPPAMRADEITNADIILGSHDHLDHIDYETWQGIAKASPEAVFVLPSLLKERISRKLQIPAERMIGLDDGKSVSLKGLTITGVASAHEALDPDPVTGEHPYLGYVVRSGERCFYHAGDTCLYEGMLAKLRAQGPYDAIFVPINGRDAARYTSGCIGNMTFQEAVDLSGALKPALAVPGHYDMFSNNLGSPIAFKAYLEAKYKGIGCWVGERGTAVEVPKKV